MKDAQRRAAELGTATFGKDGGVTAAADSDRMATEKGAAGAMAETASELIVGAAVDAAIGKIPGMKGAGKSVSKKLAQSLTGRAALRTGRKLASIGEMAHVNGLPSEVVEEVSTGLANAVGNLETKESETKTTVGGRVKDVFTRLPETAEEVAWGMAALAIVGLPVSVKAETAKWQDTEWRRDYLRGLGMGAADVEALSGEDAATLTRAVAGDLAKRAKHLELTDEQEIGLLASAGMDRDVVAAMTPEERRNHAFALADSDEMREVARAFDETEHDLQVEARRLNDLRTWNAGAETRMEKFGGDIKGGLASGKTVVDGDVAVKRDASGNGIDVVDRVTGDAVNIPMMDDGNGGMMPEVLSSVQQAADRAVRVRAAASESSGNRARIIGELASRIFTGGERVVAVENVAEAQAFVDSDRERYGDTPINEKASGATLKDGTILLVKDNVASTRDLMQTMLHERLHAAVQAAGITEGEYAGKLAELSGIDPAYLKKRAVRIRAQYARQGVSITELGAAEEALASESETGRELFRSTLWQALWQGVRGDKAGMAKARADVYGLVGGLGGKGVSVDQWTAGEGSSNVREFGSSKVENPHTPELQNSGTSELPEDSPAPSPTPAPAGFRAATPEQGARLKELGIPHAGVSFEEAEALLRAESAAPEDSGVNADAGTGSATEAVEPEGKTEPQAQSATSAPVEEATTPQEPTDSNYQSAINNYQIDNSEAAHGEASHAKTRKHEDEASAREELTFGDNGVSLDDAKAALAALAGRDLVNLETGIVARVGVNQRNKIISKKALDKSIINGFTSGQHNAAASRIDALWKHASLIEAQSDKSGDVNVSSVKRFAAPVVFGGEIGIAYITAKESIEHGHRVYSLELQEIETLRRQGGTLVKNGRATSGAFEDKLRHIVAKVNTAEIEKPEGILAPAGVNQSENPLPASVLERIAQMDARVNSESATTDTPEPLDTLTPSEEKVSLADEASDKVEALKPEVERVERNAEKELERIGEPGRRSGKEGGGAEPDGKSGAGEKDGAEARAATEVTPATAASSSTPIPPKPVRGADEDVEDFAARVEAWEGVKGSRGQGVSGAAPDVDSNRPESSRVESNRSSGTHVSLDPSAPPVQRKGESFADFGLRVAAWKKAREQQEEDERIASGERRIANDTPESLNPLTPSLTLDGGTDADIDGDAKKLAAQKKKDADREEVLHRAAAPITGSMGDMTAILPGMEETDDIPLFSQTTPKEEGVSSKEKAGKDTPEPLDPSQSSHVRDATAFATENRLVLATHDNDNIRSLYQDRFRERWQKEHPPEPPPKPDTSRGRDAAPAGFRPTTPEQGARLKMLNLPYAGFSFDEAQEMLDAVDAIDEAPLRDDRLPDQESDGRRFDTPEKFGMYGTVICQSAISGAIVGLIWACAVSARIWPGVYWGAAISVIVWSSWTWALLQSAKSYRDAIQRGGFITGLMMLPVSIIAGVIGLAVWGFRALFYGVAGS